MTDDRPASPIRAVIFDLFGTLVPEFPRSEFEDNVRTMARTLGCKEKAFLDAWRDTAMLRQTGAYAGGMHENVVAMLAAVGVTTPSDEAIDRALAPRDAMYRRWFHPRPGAVETLTAIRERNLPIAMISMCAPDTPPLWHASDLAPLVDVAVFSSETGLRKPEPSIYRYATDRLGVEPAACLYCGDGAYAELSGAAALGMTAVEIHDPAIDHEDQLRPEGEAWDGARVADLRELLPRYLAS